MFTDFYISSKRFSEQLKILADVLCGLDGYNADGAYQSIPAWYCALECRHFRQICVQDLQTLADFATPTMKISDLEVIFSVFELYGHI